MRLQKKDANRTERRGARMTFLAQPRNDWTVEVTAAAQHLRSSDTQYTTPGLGLTRVNRIAEPHVNDIGLVTARVNKVWGWGELTSSTGVVRHDYGSFYDATDVQSVYTSLADTSAYSEKTRATMAVEDIFLTSRGAGRLQWLAGLYASSTSEHSPTNFLASKAFAPNFPVSVYGDDRHDRIDELAAYGEASLEFAPGWTAGRGRARLHASAPTRTSEVELGELRRPRLNRQRQLRRLRAEGVPAA